jgi:hypothetical protein
MKAIMLEQLNATSVKLVDVESSAEARLSHPSPLFAFNQMLSMYLSFLFITAVSALQLTDYPFNRPEITNFISQISSSSYLSEKFAKADNYTILAPTNKALNIWLANNNDASLFNATITYHLLQGIHSSSSLKDGSQLLVSSLIDSSWCNVTGGQRVESQNRNGNVVFESWLKNESTITSAVSPPLERRSHREQYSLF